MAMVHFGGDAGYYQEQLGACMVAFASASYPSNDSLQKKCSSYVTDCKIQHLLTYEGSVFQQLAVTCDRNDLTCKL